MIFKIKAIFCSNKHMLREVELAYNTRVRGPLVVALSVALDCVAVAPRRQYRTIFPMIPCCYVIESHPHTVFNLTVVSPYFIILLPKLFSCLFFCDYLFLFLTAVLFCDLCFAPFLFFFKSFAHLLLM